MRTHPWCTSKPRTNLVASDFISPVTWLTLATTSNGVVNSRLNLGTRTSSVDSAPVTSGFLLARDSLDTTTTTTPYCHVMLQMEHGTSPVKELLRQHVHDKCCDSSKPELNPSSMIFFVSCSEDSKMSLDIQIYMRWTLLYIIGCIYFTVFRYLYILLYGYIWDIQNVCNMSGSPKRNRTLFFLTTQQAIAGLCSCR